MGPAVFRVVQLAVMAIFAALISDFRRRKGSSPLLPAGAVLLLKAIYPVPFLVYLWVVLHLREPAARDLLALALTAAGALFVARARIDIGASYTWTGYRQLEPRLVTNGIYGWVRHPIYGGIWLFMVGGTLTVFGRVSLAAHVLAGASIAYIGAFLVMAAARETRVLAAALGDDFDRYRRRVGAFWPVLRRR